MGYDHANRNPLQSVPARAAVDVSVEDDGAFVVLRIALHFDRDALTDLALRLTGATMRARRAELREDAP